MFGDSDAGETDAQRLDIYLIPSQQSGYLGKGSHFNQLSSSLKDLIAWCVFYGHDVIVV